LIGGWGYIEMIIDRKAMEAMEMALPQETQDRVKRAAAWIAETKEKGGKVVVAWAADPICMRE
jgi:hypothetical protein